MLEAAGLTKAYRGRTVLYPIDLRLSEGECLGLAGPNGSGKSTLLAQTVRPDGGTLREGGKSVLGDRAFLRRSMGYVPQEDALLEDLTVEEHLRLWQGLLCQRGALPEEILELLGLGALLDRRIQTLSGGMKKRLSIALALLNHPRYLLMDEAFASLDEGYRGTLTTWLLRYVQGGGSLLWCSHEPDELRVLCGRVILLEEGRRTGGGPRPEVRKG